MSRWSLAAPDRPGPPRVVRATLPPSGRPGFAAHAVIDADGDGRFREYVATDGEAARLVGEAGEL